MKKIKIIEEFKTNKNVAIATIVFFLVELTLLLHRHWNYYPSYASFDQGTFNQIFWNNLHGRWFQTSLASSLSVSVATPDVYHSHLGQHFTPALILWLPFYALFPTSTTLLVLSVALVTAGGVVLYLLARERLDVRLSTLITIGFYSTKAVIGPTLANFQDLNQLPLFTFGLLLALEKRSWRWFCVCAMLVLAVREDTGIVLFSIGLYLIFSKRYPWIGLTTCLLSFAYVFVVTSYVMPLFSQDVSQRFLIEQFGHFVETGETSTLAVLWAIISNPWRLFLEIINPVSRTIQYVFNHSFPLVFVPLLSPSTWALVAAPLLVLFVRNDHWAMSMNMRFATTVVPGLFYGAILWWSSHPGAFKPWLRRFWIFCLGASIFFALTSNPHRALSFVIPDAFDPLVYASPASQWQRAAIINSFLQQIPSDASVSATTHIVPRISNRREIVEFPTTSLINDAKEEIAVDYIVADLGQLQQYQGAFSDDRERLLKIIPVVNKLLKEGRYGVLDCRDGVFLMQRGATSNTVSKKELERVLRQ